MRGVLRSLLAVALGLAAISCGEAAQQPFTWTPTDDGEDGGEELCVDRDRDGYGRNCDQGSDCDDDNPRVTDECRRCLTVTKDCPCKAGTAAQKCTPPTIHVDGGVLVCTEGTRYCRDSYWGDCETIGEYVFQKQ
jgi:hypothetical protein